MHDPPPPTAPRQAAGPPPPTKLGCPYCRLELQLAPHHAGQVVACPNCGGQFQAPPLPGTSGVAGFGEAVQVDGGIRGCILISALANLLSGLFWISTLCGIVIGVPQIILAIFEILYFAQPFRGSLSQAITHAQLLGVLEIFSGLFNLISLVCGILVLVFAANHRQ
jgi:hypothetical protein